MRKYPVGVHETACGVEWANWDASLGIIWDGSLQNPFLLFLTVILNGYCVPMNHLTEFLRVRWNLYLLFSWLYGDWPIVFQWRVPNFSPLSLAQFYSYNPLEQSGTTKVSILEYEHGIFPLSRTFQSCKTLLNVSRRHFDWVRENSCPTADGFLWSDVAWWLTCTGFFLKVLSQKNKLSSYEAILLFYIHRQTLKKSRQIE